MITVLFKWTIYSLITIIHAMYQFSGFFFTYVLNDRVNPIFVVRLNTSFAPNEYSVLVASTWQKIGMKGFVTYLLQ